MSDTLDNNLDTLQLMEMTGLSFSDADRLLKIHHGDMEEALDYHAQNPHLTTLSPSPRPVRDHATSYQDPSQDRKVQQVMAQTGANVEDAREALELVDWNVKDAVTIMGSGSKGKPKKSSSANASIRRVPFSRTTDRANRKLNGGDSATTSGGSDAVFRLNPRPTGRRPKSAYVQNEVQQRLQERLAGKPKPKSAAVAPKKRSTVASPHTPDGGGTVADNVDLFASLHGDEHREYVAYLLRTLKEMKEGNIISPDIEQTIVNDLLDTGDLEAVAKMMNDISTSMVVTPGRGEDSRKSEDMSQESGFVPGYYRSQGVLDEEASMREDEDATFHSQGPPGRLVYDVDDDGDSSNSDGESNHWKGLRAGKETVTIEQGNHRNRLDQTENRPHLFDRSPHPYEYAGVSDSVEVEHVRDSDVQRLFDRPSQSYGLQGDDLLSPMEPIRVPTTSGNRNRVNAEPPPPAVPLVRQLSARSQLRQDQDREYYEGLAADRLAEEQKRLAEEQRQLEAVMQLDRRAHRYAYYRRLKDRFAYLLPTVFPDAASNAAAQASLGEGAEVRIRMKLPTPPCTKPTVDIRLPATTRIEDFAEVITLLLLQSWATRHEEANPDEKDKISVGMQSLELAEEIKGVSFVVDLVYPMRRIAQAKDGTRDFEGEKLCDVGLENGGSIVVADASVVEDV